MFELLLVHNGKGNAVVCPDSDDVTIRWRYTFPADGTIVSDDHYSNDTVCVYNGNELIIYSDDPSLDSEGNFTFFQITSNSSVKVEIRYGEIR